MAFIADYWRGVYNHHQPEILFNRRTSDPFLRWANRVGLEVELYTPRPTPWDQFPRHMIAIEVFLISLAMWFYINRGTSGVMRKIAGGIGMVAVTCFTPIYGRTHIGLVDFGIPALAFLTDLHLFDIFFLRQAEDTKDWDFGRMYVETMGFPAEEQPPNPRWVNVKALGLNVGKALLVNILLYFIPAPHQMAKVTHWFPWIMYHANVGWVIMLVLGCVVESILRIYGIIFGYAMKPMFNNPLLSSNLREFWGKWNLAVKEALHTAIFHAKAKKQKEKKAKVQSIAKSKGISQAQARQHMDGLSETDMSSVEDEKKKRAKANGKPANGGAVSKKPAGKSSTKSFARKALAATATFAVSGLFHEYMNHLAFDGLTGLNLAFFLAHAAGTIAYTWILRNYPSIPGHTPWFVGFLIVSTFSIVTSPLFCVPFTRVGFFEDYKVVGVFGPIRGVIYTFGR